MTDKQVSGALLPAPDESAGIRVTCNGSDLVFDRPIGFGRMGVNYRFDDGPVTPRIAGMSSDGRTAWLWPLDAAEARNKMARGKRLRIEIFPTGASSRFIEFDLTGAKEAFAQMKCSKR